MEIELKQSVRLPSQAVLDRHSHVVLAVADAPRKWPEFGYRHALARRCGTRLDNDEPPSRQRLADLPNGRATRVALRRIPAAAAPFRQLSAARRLVAAHRDDNPETLALVVAGYEPPAALRLAEALVAAALAAAAPLPSCKSKPAPPPRLRRLYLYGARARDGFRRSFAEAEGNALARELSILPGNRLAPAQYLQRLRRLAARHGWQLDFLGLSELRRRKAGAFLAVAQAAPDPGSGIVCLRYRPGAARAGAGGRVAGRVALVGKGICFDTGGVNLKPARHMYGMHGDMQGSAVALGTLLALTRLQARIPVDCWLALAVNHIGPAAYRPNDVVTALNGTTIEIVHTDAEGRMVLADTLTLAGRSRPRLIVDYATLTGACVYALGTGYSGVFSNRDAWLPALAAAGRDSGERIWPFPMDEDYDRSLESDIADLKQCAPDGDADHILAARFLRRFVPRGTPWIHLDLSSGSRKGGLAHIPTEVTGFGVRLSLRLLLDKALPPG